MGFQQIVTFIQEWLVSNISPPVEVVVSLALQMNMRMAGGHKNENSTKQKTLNKSKNAPPGKPRPHLHHLSMSRRSLPGSSLT
ncbi:hypothetical protein M378DRAFT_346405 [Amanita muscaria Koide BX008]|uniref:Uncharacterized protein n=1 Tax=Amanita muscaria (strain Koide BX008) TaxID=946122 RepID=A0A0C2W9V3_AMAMK|nr:hypothetical protein M378DRAFT_346405 [Amanita muscaria Koide BX008]